MCLVSKDKNLHIAFKNIPVKKLIVKDNREFIMTPFRKCRITSRFLKPDRTPDFVDMIDMLFMGELKGRHIDGGFIHCYSLDKTISLEQNQELVDAHIPIGAIYAVGDDGDLCATEVVIERHAWINLTI